MMLMKIQLFYPTAKLLPHDKQWRGDEDRGISADEDADRHKERERAGRGGAVEEKH